MAEPCRNCGAPATGSDPLGPVCCATCALHPLGCRCKYGEPPDTAETMEFAPDEDDEPIDDATRYALGAM
jgi:hypothetical protein